MRVEKLRQSDSPGGPPRDICITRVFQLGSESILYIKLSKFSVQNDFVSFDASTVLRNDKNTL